MTPAQIKKAVQAYLSSIYACENTMRQAKEAIEQLQKQCPHEQDGESTWTMQDPRFAPIEKCSICGDVRIRRWGE